MNGNNILIFMGESPIAATKSHEIQTECEAIEISATQSNGWRERIAGRRSWSVNANYLVMAEADLSKLLQIGNSYTLTIQARNHDTGDTNVSGTAILTQCKQTYTRGNLCVGSFQFVGNGPLR